MSGAARTKAGAVAGTGAAIEVEVGFTPKHVKLVRDVSGTSHCSMEAFASMLAASGYKITDDGAGVVTARMVTSNGITFGTDPAGKFTIGADTDMNISGVQIRWIATE